MLKFFFRTTTCKLISLFVAIYTIIFILASNNFFLCEKNHIKVENGLAPWSITCNRLTYEIDLGNLIFISTPENLSVLLEKSIFSFFLILLLFGVLMLILKALGLIQLKKAAKKQAEHAGEKAYIRGQIRENEETFW